MPERDWITFTVDGREVRAPEGELLLEAAKRGDVEVPFFCYERKLGPPVGACRMCLVEIEGMPKLQVSCATPVKDGMVVNTQTDRVKQAQNAVVEFLLVNHPLDCPVCDKGGECPLQDISYGWGPGKSRFVEPKRNFPKPIALSPLIAIDRERCILCYRCVRFSQEVSEDHQLVFLDRADHTLVGTFDGLPYVAPFSGNVIELCPVGALTSTAYRFRARPWEIVDSGSICTLCPSQCNIRFSVRDDRVERVIARENDNVDSGWLCDKGRFGYQSIHSSERILSPLVRDGGMLRPESWERALDRATAGLRKAGAGCAGIAGSAASNEEGYLLQRILRGALGSEDIDSRVAVGIDTELAGLLARPELSARVADLDEAAVVLVLSSNPIDDAPIVDLRVRRAVRRFGAKLIVAASGPTALDGGATELVSFAPGGEEAFLRALQRAMIETDPDAPAKAPAASDSGSDAEPGAAEGHQPREAASPLPGQQELIDFLGAQPVDRLAAAAGAEVGAVCDAARILIGAESIVILWGERLSHGERGAAALRALVDLALLAGVDGGEGSGLIEVPLHSNARGLREVGCLPALGPGLAPRPAGRNAAQARDAARRRELEAFYLLGADPLREHPGKAAWEEALASAGFVVAHEQFLTETIERHADVVFPAESYAEKEGTVTHPDGRLQRLRPGIGHPDGVRAGWRVLLELGRRLGLDLTHSTLSEVVAEIADAVPFYRGITLDEIGGRGVRWQERERSLEAASERLPALRFSSPEQPAPLPEAPEGALRLCPRPSLWASWETERSPALDFLAVEQALELHPADAERLAIEDGEEVDVVSNGSTLRARARLREAARKGCCYLIEGTARDGVNLLADGEPVVVEIGPRDRAGVTGTRAGA